MMRDLRFLWTDRDARRFLPILPLVVGLGVCAALSESLGISLVVGLASALAEGELPTTGFLSQVYAEFARSFGAGATTLAAVAFALLAFKALANWAFNVMGSWARNTISESVRNRGHAHFLRLPYIEVSRRDRGEMINLLSMESWSIADAYFCASRVLVHASALTAYAIFVSLISWKIAALTVLGAGAILAFNSLITTPARKLGASPA